MKAVKPETVASLEACGPGGPLPWLGSEHTIPEETSAQPRPRNQWSTKPGCFSPQISISSCVLFSGTRCICADSNVRERWNIVTPRAEGLFQGSVEFCYFLPFCLLRFSLLGRQLGANTAMFDQLSRQVSDAQAFFFTSQHTLPPQTSRFSWGGKFILCSVHT